MSSMWSTNKKRYKMTTEQVYSRLDTIDSMFTNRTSWPIPSEQIEGIVQILMYVCKNQQEEIEDLQSEVKQLWKENGHIKYECKNRPL